MKRTHTNTKATTTTNRIESLAQASARPPTKNIYILIAAAITNFLSHFYRFVVFFVSRPEEKVTFVLVCFIDQNTQNGPKYCCCSLPLMLCRIPKWYDCTVKREIGHRSHWLLFFCGVSASSSFLLFRWLIWLFWDCVECHVHGTIAMKNKHCTLTYRSLQFASGAMSDDDCRHCRAFVLSPRVFAVSLESNRRCVRAECQNMVAITK